MELLFGLLLATLIAMGAAFTYYAWRAAQVMVLTRELMPRLLSSLFADPPDDFGD